mmetsp:Transcript_70206/g.196787  ORF Transcript_70206/g.196787 Transcript_70206/m.196787 type:complete len:332 (-) Transcript_70206:22-1017(-)
MAAERAFDEQWVPLIHSFVTKAPPGSVADVCEAIRQLVQAKVPDELMGRSCTDHHEKLLTAVALPSPNGGVGLVCETGRVGSRAQMSVAYKHPSTEQVFVVDQEQGVSTGMKDVKRREGDLSAELDNLDREVADPFKAALEGELEAYMREHYPRAAESGTLQGSDGQAGYAIFLSGGKEVGNNQFEIRAYLSARRARPKGYWVGNWTSQWKITLTPGQSEPAVLGGVVEFRTHYAEESNFHSRRKALRRVKIQETQDPAKWAKEVAEGIRKVEDEFHCGTEDYCATVGSGALKSMRRVLPLSKERFDWRPIRHALVKDLKHATDKCERPGA